MSVEVEVEDTKLAKDCEREDAVDWSCVCMLLVLLLWNSGLDSEDALGLESVFSRRRMPDTAYETGYVKYEEERFGVDRCEDGVCLDEERECGKVGGSAVTGMNAICS